MTVEATGLTWKASLEGDLLTIERSPIWGRGSERWDFSVRQLSGVQFEAAGMISAGKLKLIGADLHHPFRHLLKKEPNVLDFTRHEQPDFERLRDAIAAKLGTVTPPS
jgi:uncharacterized protein (DUF2235 family)